jgi:hypothetical protein
MTDDKLCFSCTKPDNTTVGCCYGDYEAGLISKEPFNWKCDGKPFNGFPAELNINKTQKQICSDLDKLNQGSSSKYPNRITENWTGDDNIFPFGKTCPPEKSCPTCPPPKTCPPAKECPPQKIVEKMVPGGSCTDINTAKKTVIGALEAKKNAIRKSDMQRPVSAAINLVGEL